MTRPIRAAFLTVMPAPYMQDVFAAMRNDGRIDPRVFYMDMSMPGTYWGDRELPEHEIVLPGRGIEMFGGRIHWNPDVISSLQEADADIYVISGYSSITSQIASAWLRRLNRPCFFFGERPGIHPRRAGGRFLRHAVMSVALRDAWAIAAVGESAVQAYQTKSRASLPIYNIPYYTDLTPFQYNPSLPERETNALRFLYCGQLIERKGVDLLVQSFCEVASQHPHVKLDLVGTGPLMEPLNNSIPPHLRDRIGFHGFSPIESLPHWFSHADIFVLPSRHDGWGVVVNQALAAGLPIIATDAVGAAQDFVENRGTGTIVPTGDQQALTRAMEYFAHNPQHRRDCANQSLKVAEELSLERGVERWLRMFEETLDRSGASTRTKDAKSQTN